jgi:hypothetical protein
MTTVLTANVRVGSPADPSNTTAPTQFMKTWLKTCAYRRFGAGVTRGSA